MHLSQENRSPVNVGPPEYEAGMFTTPPRRSVNQSVM
jgi:hypothetical protein